MDERTETERQLMRYLLGELSEEEKTRLEERFFAEDDYFAELLAVEDDLIDEYVQDALSPRERALFEQHFLVSSQRQRRVALKRMLWSRVSEAPAADVP